MKGDLKHKGWEQMEGILDVEMPIKKRKRRFAWWWFAVAAAVAVVGLLGYFHIESSPEQTIAVAESILAENPVSSKKVAIEEVKVAQENPIEADAIESNASKSSTKYPTSPQEKPALQSSTDLALMSARTESGNNSSTIVEVRSKIGANRKTSPVEIAKPSRLKEESEVTGIIEQPNQLANSSIVSSDNFSPIIITIAKLPTMILKIVGTESFDLQPSTNIALVTFDAPAIEPATKSETGRFQFGLYADGFLSSSFKGLGGGVAARYQYNRWSVGVGAGYSQMSFSNTGGGSGPEDEMTPEALDLQDVSLLLQDVTYIDLGLYTAYQLVGPLSMELGLGYHLPQSVSNYPKSFELGSDLEINSEKVDFSEDFLSENARLNNLLSLQAGFSLQLNNNLQIGMNYQYFPSTIIDYVPVTEIVNTTGTFNAEANIAEGSQNLNRFSAGLKFFF